MFEESNSESLDCGGSQRKERQFVIDNWRRTCMGKLQNLSMRWSYSCLCSRTLNNKGGKYRNFFLHSAKEVASFQLKSSQDGCFLGIASEDTWRHGISNEHQGNWDVVALQMFYVFKCQTSFPWYPSKTSFCSLLCFGKCGSVAKVSAPDQSQCWLDPRELWVSHQTWTHDLLANVIQNRFGRTKFSSHYCWGYSVVKTRGCRTLTWDVSVCFLSPCLCEGKIGTRTYQNFEPHISDDGVENLPNRSSDRCSLLLSSRRIMWKFRW